MSVDGTSDFPPSGLRMRASRAWPWRSPYFSISLASMGRAILRGTRAWLSTPRSTLRYLDPRAFSEMVGPRWKADLPRVLLETAGMQEKGEREVSTRNLLVNCFVYRLCLRETGCQAKIRWTRSQVNSMGCLTREMPNLGFESPRAYHTHQQPADHGRPRRQ